MIKKHIFLSYCHENKDVVSTIRKELLRLGEKVWWDEDILAGQDWKLAIRTAMKESYAVILFLSKEVSERDKTGIFPEAMDAIVAYRNYSPGSIFLIPVRLSECEIPPIEIDDTRTLDRLQHLDLYPKDIFQNQLNLLLSSIKNCPEYPASKSSMHNKELIKHVANIKGNILEEPIKKAFGTSKTEHSKPHGILDKPPLTRRFEGRIKERSQLEDFLLQNVPICFVGGLSGIGKSALSSTVLSNHSVLRNKFCYWANISEQRSVSTLLYDLALAADSDVGIGATKWMQDTPCPPQQILDKFFLLIDSWPLVLVLDNIGDESKLWLEAFVVSFEKNCSIQKLILISKIRPRFLDKISPVSCKELVLEDGLSLDEVSNFLQFTCENISTQFYSQIWERTGLGFPLAVSIFASLMRSGKYTVDELLHELPAFDDEQKMRWFDILIPDLNIQEAETLSIFAIFENKFTIEVVKAIADENFSRETVDILYDRFMCSRDSQGGFIMHSLLRDFCRAQITPNKWEELHLKAANYFLESLQIKRYKAELDDKEIEMAFLGHYHLLQAGKSQRAINLVKKLQVNLIRRGRYGQLLDITEKTINTHGKMDLGLLLYQAKVFAIWGESEQCRSLIREIENKYGKSAYVECLFIELDLLVYTEKNYDQAIEFISQNLHEFRKSRNPETVSRMLVRRAVALGGKGEYQSALDTLNSLFEICKSRNDSIGQAKCLKELGRVYESSSNLKESINSFEQAATILKLLNHDSDAAEVNVALARLHLKSGDQKLAEFRANEALDWLEHVDREDLRLSAEIILQQVV